MDVTDVLRDRRGEPDGLQKMLVASVAAHVTIAALVMVAPHWGGAATEPPRTDVARHKTPRWAKHRNKAKLHRERYAGR